MEIPHENAGRTLLDVLPGQAHGIVFTSQLLFYKLADPTPGHSLCHVADFELSAVNFVEIA
ncbi:hypothetical protein D3C83_238990 [compost metagenome]